MSLGRPRRARGASRDKQNSEDRPSAGSSSIFDN